MKVSGDRPAVDVTRWLKGHQGHSFSDWKNRVRPAEPPSVDVNSECLLTFLYNYYLLLLYVCRQLYGC